VIERLVEPFHYAFMQRAFITALLVGVLCSTMGTYVILRRLAFIGDGIAHADSGGLSDTGFIVDHCRDRLDRDVRKLSDINHGDPGRH